MGLRVQKLNPETLKPQPEDSQEVPCIKAFGRKVLATEAPDQSFKVRVCGRFLGWLLGSLGSYKGFGLYKNLHMLDCHRSSFINVP